MIKIFGPEGAEPREIAKSYNIVDLLTKNDSSSLSIVVAKAADHYEITMNTESDRAYYILSGEMQINGKKCYAGGIVYIPKKTEYQFEGSFDALIIDSPSFDPAHDLTKLCGPKLELQNLGD